MIIPLIFYVMNLFKDGCCGGDCKCGNNNDSGCGGGTCSTQK